MSAVTPPCCQTHFAKSEHHSSLAFSTPNPWLKPHPSSLAEKPATSELNGSQSTPPKLVTSGVSDTPTWPSAISAIACPLGAAWLAAAAPDPAGPFATGWLASGALEMEVLVFMAARACWACVRCDAAEASQFAGSARCHACRTAAGSPRPQP